MERDNINAAGQDRVRRRSSVNPVTGCWRWIGASRGVGYGAVKVGGRVIDAHRYAWEVFHGAIPEGQHVLHKCDNRACVNPEHLELGTPSKNRADAIARGAIDPKANCRRRRVSPARLARIVRDYDAGVSLKQLVGKHHIPPTTLRRLLVAGGRRLPGDANA
jgi:hypothetical protein